jgi:hypothetical protein
LLLHLQAPAALCMQPLWLRNTQQLPQSLLLLHVK